MDFSLFYFANDSSRPGDDRYDLLVRGARFADERGFTAVWTPERHFHPFGGLYPNPAVTGAAIATITDRIQIRAGSVVAPLHHPLRIAEEWAVVDNLSHGRVGLSFAAGWHAVDFALRPEAYEDRRSLLLDSVDRVRRLWRGEDMAVLDGNGKEQRVRSYPRPVRAELPVWVTSAGGIETFRNAGRAGAGVLTHLLGQDLDELGGKIAAYREEYAKSDLGDGGDGHVALMVHTYLDDDEDAARETVREPLSAYLRSSLGLILGSGATGRRQVDPSKLKEKDVDFLVARSFERYFEEGGLLGRPDRAQRTVERIRAAGVDEIACLIDFGVGTEEVLASLSHLDRLRERCAGL